MLSNVELSNCLRPSQIGSQTISQIGVKPIPKHFSTNSKPIQTVSELDLGIFDPSQLHVCASTKSLHFHEIVGQTSNTLVETETWTGSLTINMFAFKPALVHSWKKRVRLCWKSPILHHAARTSSKTVSKWFPLGVLEGHRLFWLQM